jgi:hypothetical protein
MAATKCNVHPGLKFKIVMKMPMHFELKNTQVCNVSNSLKVQISVVILIIV